MSSIVMSSSSRAEIEISNLVSSSSAFKICNSLSIFWCLEMSTLYHFKTEGLITYWFSITFEKNIILDYTTVRMSKIAVCNWAVLFQWSAWLGFTCAECLLVFFIFKRLFTNIEGRKWRSYTDMNGSTYSVCEKFTTSWIFHVVIQVCESDPC
jgi:hypothetical protein